MTHSVLVSVYSDFQTHKQNQYKLFKKVLNYQCDTNNILPKPPQSDTYNDMPENPEYKLISTPSLSCLKIILPLIAKAKAGQKHFKDTCICTSRAI